METVLLSCVYTIVVCSKWDGLLRHRVVTTTRKTCRLCTWYSRDGFKHKILGVPPSPMGGGGGGRGKDSIFSYEKRNNTNNKN